MNTLMNYHNNERRVMTGPSPGVLPVGRGMELSIKATGRVRLRVSNGGEECPQGQPCSDTERVRGLLPQVKGNQ